MRFAVRNFVLALALLCPALLADVALAKDAKPPAATKAPAPSPEIEIPQSVFLIPPTPKEGRNPFFPRSTATLPPPTKIKENLADSSSLHLTGITSPPRATAMINNKTFEKGEEGEVKLASGNKLLIRCEQITQDSVVILINGSQRRELRLRGGV